MPLSHTANITFSSTSFTSSGPIGSDVASQTLGVGNVNSYKWANKTRQLNLGNNDYGYITLDISYTVTGTADVVAISLYNDDYLVTFSETLSGLFKPSVAGYYIKLTPGQTKRIYAIVNSGESLSPMVPINFIVGRRGTLPSNVTITLNYDCTNVGPLYKYLADMHAYSAYDAANNAKLKTYLYSYTPIGSWTTNTEVYSAPTFTQLAYPYYYSIGSYTYKVGGILERSFGIQRFVELYKANQFPWTKTKFNQKQSIVKSWKGVDIDGFIMPNFVYPYMSEMGKIKSVLTSSTLLQPSSYRYYLGAAPTVQATADFFTQFDFGNRAVHTISGFEHALQHFAAYYLLASGVSLKSDQQFFENIAYLLGAAFVQYVGNGWSLGGGFVVAAFRDIVFNILRLLKGVKLVWGPDGAAVPLLNAVKILGLSIACWIMIIQIAIIIYKLFQATRVDVFEPNIYLKYRYANTPYLDNGTTLYTNPTLTTSKSEYYCDGIYFYNQSSSATISGKELSYTLNGLISADPLKKGLLYSFATDTGDTGSIVIDYAKLLALPYCSGVPDIISGYYKNTKQSTSYTPLNTCGDLLVFPSTLISEVPEGSIISTISQNAANTEALTYANFLATQSAASGSFGTISPNSVGSGFAFTHEIKVETYPNTGSCFFDNTNNAGLTVGKSLYYDPSGTKKVLNGYYTTESGSLSGYASYRTFFKTTNGAVSDILTMGSSVATTVTSLVNSTTYPVQTTNQGYTSDWYWYEISYSDLSDSISYPLTPCLNLNTLYNDSRLKAGFNLLDTSSFYTYTNNLSTSSYSEAAPGWYYAFDSDEYPYSFTYNTATTLSINLTEVCFTDYAVGEPYGINISGATGSASSSFYYPVNMTLNAYNGGSLITSFSATASAEGITYVDFPAPITKDSNVTNVTVASISSPNPNNKILYVGGTFTNCNPTTPAPTTAAPTTAAPTTASPTPNPTTPAPTTASPTTAAPTPNPTTAAPTPNPTTAAPTPAPTNPFGGTIYYSTISAFDVCNNASMPLSVTGNNGDFCSSTIFTGAGWTSLPQNTYWIKYIGDTKVVQVYHAAGADNVGRVTGCNECPTPSPTTAPTTSSPTTAPTTAAPTTASPTTAPTTAAPTTPNPTTPPTPAPTSPFGGTIEYSSISAADVCNNGSTPLVVTGNNGTFCTSTIFTGAGWTSLPTGNYYIKWIGDTKVVQVFHASNADNVGRITGCNECPTPSPTAAPTTAAPTTPPTPPPTTPPTPPPTTPPTPPPTTASPTTPPTPPPTTPPTPPPTTPPTTPPTPPPTPPPTTPPTPPPTTPPTPPPTPSPTETPYYYYDVRPCFGGSDLVARSLDINLNGVYAANGTCYFIIGVAVPGDWAFTIGTADYQGGSCYVSGCGYSPPPIAPPPTSSGWECEPFVGCYESVFSIQSQFECNQSCPQPE